MFRKVDLSYRQVIPVCFDRVMQLATGSASMIWLLHRRTSHEIACLLFWGIKIILRDVLLGVIDFCY